MWTAKDLDSKGDLIIEVHGRCIKVGGKRKVIRMPPTYDRITRGRIVTTDKFLDVSNGYGGLKWLNADPFDVGLNIEDFDFVCVVRKR